MKFTRHWKEVFDPTNEFIFLKKLKLGVPGHEVVAPGDAMADEVRATLGEHRLKVWWNARVIGSREYAIAAGIVPQEVAKSRVRPTGRGWFEVELPDGSIRKIRGRESAEQLLHPI